jgi:hypothetical protein
MNRDNRFAYGLNGDGTYDSICPYCYMTVANVKTESELAPPEGQHICDPARFHQNRRALDTWLSEISSSRRSANRA